jgi:hypothetical protein
MVRLALALAGTVLLATCTYSNLCPKVCLEEGCCDPSCRTPGDDLTSCDPKQDCTYMGVNYTITCGSDSEWHCNGGFDFCCPIHQPTVGTVCTSGLQCVFAHGVECECDSGEWVCAGLDAGGGPPVDMTPLDGGATD